MNPQEDRLSTEPTSEFSPTQIQPAPKSSVTQINREVRNLVLDYAIAASIVGLIPIPGIIALKLMFVAGGILKMISDIREKWGFSRGQDWLAVVGNLFGGLGALAMAFMAWLTLFAIGVFIPIVGSFAIAASLFTLTWSLGQTINQFYASSYKE